MGAHARARSRDVTQWECSEELRPPLLPLLQASGPGTKEANDAAAKKKVFVGSAFTEPWAFRRTRGVVSVGLVSHGKCRLLLTRLLCFLFG